MRYAKIRKLRILNALAVYRLQPRLGNVVKFVAVDSLRTPQLARTCNHPVRDKMSAPRPNIYGVLLRRKGIRCRKLDYTTNMARKKRLRHAGLDFCGAHAGFTTQILPVRTSLLVYSVCCPPVHPFSVLKERLNRSVSIEDINTEATQA